MIRKTTFSSDGFTLPYHFSLGTSVSDSSCLLSAILYGPPLQVGTVVLNASNEALSPAGVSSGPTFSAMCAGYRKLNRLIQSGYALSKVSVTVLPLSEPVTDEIRS